MKGIARDRADLKLAAGLSKSDQNRIIKDAVKLYRKESGRAALNQLAKSDVHYVVGTGQLASTPNAAKSAVLEEFGRTEPAAGTLKGTQDPKTGNVDYIERKDLTINITLDLAKLDRDQTEATQGRMTSPHRKSRFSTTK